MSVREMTSSATSMVHSVRWRLSRYARIKRDTDTLRARSDHELEDIGLAWTDIDYAVRNGRRPA